MIDTLQNVVTLAREELENETFVLQENNITLEIRNNNGDLLLKIKKLSDTDIHLETAKDVYDGPAELLLRM